MILQVDVPNEVFVLMGNAFVGQEFVERSTLGGFAVRLVIKLKIIMGGNYYYGKFTCKK